MNANRFPWLYWCQLKTDICIFLGIPKVAHVKFHICINCTQSRYSLSFLYYRKQSEQVGWVLQSIFLLLYYWRVLKERTNFQLAGFFNFHCSSKSRLLVHYLWVFTSIVRDNTISCTKPAKSALVILKEEFISVEIQSFHFKWSATVLHFSLWIEYWILISFKGNWSAVMGKGSHVVNASTHVCLV